MGVINYHHPFRDSLNRYHWITCISPLRRWL